MPAYWDTSAILHLCVPGQASRHAKELLRSFPPVVWWGTSVEVHSALMRLRRAGHISTAAYHSSNQRLVALVSSWKEIQPGEALRDLAMTQLDRFPLTAADAFQLGAALIWSKQKPRGRLFICNDTRLRAAAAEAGFEVEQV